MGPPCPIFGLVTVMWRRVSQAVREVAAETEHPDPKQPIGTEVGKGYYLTGNLA